MDAKIKQTFWTDPDFVGLPPEDMSAMRLTFLWMVTSPLTNLIGVLRFSPQVFELETGLNRSYFERTVRAFPESFRISGDEVLLINFVRHQYGTGGQLTRNKFSSSLAPLVHRLRRDLKSVLLREYPELAIVLKSWILSGSKTETSGSKTETSGSNAKRSEPTNSISEATGPVSTDPDQNLEDPDQKKFDPDVLKFDPPEKRREEQSREESLKGGVGENSQPTMQEIIAYGQQVGIPEEICRQYWLKRDETGWQARPGLAVVRWQSGLLAWAQDQRQFEARRRTPGGRPSSPASTGSSLTYSLEEIEARLEYERDPNVRADLEKKRAALKGER